MSRILDAGTPGADLYAVLVAIHGEILLHYHAVIELQYILSGTGLTLDAGGGETPISPGARCSVRPGRPAPTDPAPPAHCLCS